MSHDFSGPSWDLSVVYTGVDDPMIENDIAEVESFLQAVAKLNKDLVEDNVAVAQQIFVKLQNADEVYSNLSTYANCLLSVNSADEDAQRLFGRLQRHRKEINSLSKPLHEFEALAGEEILESYLNHGFVGQARFSVLHRRQLASQLLSRSEEQLIEELAQNGLHAWGNLYDRLSGSIECNVLVSEPIPNCLGSSIRDFIPTGNPAAFNLCWTNTILPAHFYDGNFPFLGSSGGIFFDSSREKMGCFNCHPKRDRTSLIQRSRNTFKSGSFNALTHVYL